MRIHCMSRIGNWAPSLRLRRREFTTMCGARRHSMKKFSHRCAVHEEIHFSTDSGDGIMRRNGVGMVDFSQDFAAESENVVGGLW